MDLEQLRAFVTIVDAGGVSAAAQALNRTQSAVTKRLQALERAAGQPLMDRLARTLVLTPAGQRLLPHARRVLTEADAARRALDETADALTGSLAIATSHHIGLHRLPPVLEGFVRDHPGVDLHIDFLDSEDGCAAVAQGTRELAIVTLPDAPNPVLATRVVWDDPLVFVAAPDHPLATRSTGGAPIAIDTLAAHPAILPDARTFTHRRIAAALAQAGLRPQIRMATNYLETIRMLVGIGLGWSALPATMVDERLVRLDVPITLDRALGTVVHRDRTLSGAAQALCERLHRSRP